MTINDHTAAGRRERRSIKRRQEILNAAAAIFRKRGYHGASIREIAEAADLADGTLYNYFANKEAVLVALFEQLIQLEKRAQYFESMTEVSLDSLLRRYFQMHLESARANHSLFLALIPEILVTPELRERYYAQFVAPLLQIAEAEVQARSQRGELRKLDAKHISRAVFAQFFGFLCLQILGDPHSQPSERNDAAFVDSLVELFLHGVAAAPE